MRRFAWIVLAFPVIELIGLVLLAGRIGGLATLLWLVASALVGMWILRNQRLGLLLTAWGALNQGGQMSLYQMLWPLRFLLAGVLLIFPGVISDIIALNHSPRAGLRPARPSRRPVAGRAAAAAESRR
jgi:UPF0716 protein FxsA